MLTRWIVSSGGRPWILLLLAWMLGPVCGVGVWAISSQDPESFEGAVWPEVVLVGTHCLAGLLVVVLLVWGGRYRSRPEYVLLWLYAGVIWLGVRAQSHHEVEAAMTMIGLIVFLGGLCVISRLFWIWMGWVVRIAGEDGRANAGGTLTDAEDAQPYDDGTGH